MKKNRKSKIALGCFLFFLLLADSLFFFYIGQKYSTEKEITGLIIPLESEILENGYPHNKAGETYGPAVYGMDSPDLILAEGENGAHGYIRFSDYESPKTPEEAMKVSGKQYKYNLYLQDGVTIVGAFLTE